MHEDGVRLNERLAIRDENRNLAITADLPKLGRSFVAFDREIDGPVLVL
jgi:hypothetical protein